MADLRTISDELQESWQKLYSRWQHTSSVWNDPVRQKFEKEYWQPLSTEVFETQRELQNLAHVISKARRNVR